MKIRNVEKGSIVFPPKILYFIIIALIRIVGLVFHNYCSINSFGID